MNAIIGTAGLVVSIVGSISGIISYLFGIRAKDAKSIRRSGGFVVLVFAGALISTGAMQHGLLTHDFSLSNVASNSSRETPLLYQITGMWSSLAGSILLWATILALYLVLVLFKYRKRELDVAFGWAMVVGLVVAGFFFIMMATSANPFLTLAHPPIDGSGPNPLLQNYPLVAFHPPMLYMGYVGFTVPFAFGIASLISNRSDTTFARETRYWALVAWIFLTLGIFLGAWWSYQVLGWGGYWAWDPVENSAFLPWLFGTAYLHSSMSGSRGGNMKIWNIGLLVATFSMTILGTFFTRSGVLQSVHAFSGSTLGPILIIFFAFVTVVSFGLIAWRASSMRASSFSATGINRDGTYLVNNLLFSAFAGIVLLGTTFPLLAQAINNSIVSVGPPFFNAFTAPLGLALLFFMTVSPFVPYTHISIKSLFNELFVPLMMGLLAMAIAVFLGSRDKGLIAAYGFGTFALTGSLKKMIGVLLSRRGQKQSFSVRAHLMGGLIAHIGVAVVAIALATSTAFGVRGEVKISPFQSAYFQGHKLTYEGVSTLVTPAKTSLRAAIMIDGRGPFYPAISQFGTNSQVVGTPSVSAGILRDVSVTLDSPPQSAKSQVIIGVVVEPLVSWLWIGGVIMGLGGGLALLGSLRFKSKVPQINQLKGEAVGV
ncbi:heme lyase CcmF/NrfE family subunit [Acidithrix ferrooxidans]|uniref:Cytochrome c-type biogenesis protein CcmF n=1 Tax=Acidithrix ferrooxidans TaxID=1280514 RepID=A0A0D8HD01_9ACTN|nr:cytochrome c-type biogenesis CcmF C-terminal domain-containing protein [Acidithrix ferrooxidans]KJF15677.1 cytochrome c-type biogenesis protein CcmF [Acidithrix ferrooxidans]